MPSPNLVLLLRLGGAILASAVFGLVAAAAFPPWNFWVAFGLGFLFGTAFMVGTGYRILVAVARRRIEPTPVSWSGATAATALLTLAIGVALMLQGRETQFVWLALGIAINFAYLPIKTACLKVGCCQAVRPFALRDLRVTEIALSLAVIVVAAVFTATGSVQLGGCIAIGGHLGIRLLSRHMRERWSWGWPPFRQPGAELFPVALVLAAAAFA
jgi:hypothetical protein